LPPIGNFQRYRVLEWLNFITTELHKSFAPLFKADAADEVKAHFKKLIGERLDYVEGKFGDGPYLMGATFTLPDAYLFVITGWADKMIGLDKWPKLKAFRERMMERDSVRQVLKLEGLLKEEAV
jgi:glutathione S-transferase